LQNPLDLTVKIRQELDRAAVLVRHQPAAAVDVPVIELAALLANVTL
jgi:hypothetical protein